MKAADANQRYAMRLLEQDETGYLVEVKPLLKEDQETFSIAYIYLDSAYLLPKRISLLGPDRKSSKHFQLSNIKANQPVNDRLFVGVNPGHGFKLQRNPGGQAPATNLRAPATIERPNRKASSGRRRCRPAPLSPLDAVNSRRTNTTVKHLPPLFVLVAGPFRPALIARASLRLAASTGCLTLPIAELIITWIASGLVRFAPSKAC